VRNTVSNSNVDWDGLAVWNQSGIYFVNVNLTLNKFYTDSYSTNKRRSVAAHEFGHALGLDDRLATQERLMNGMTNERYDVFGIYIPTSIEIGLINTLY
jgi:hypothetical protein